MKNKPGIVKKKIRKNTVTLSDGTRIETDNNKEGQIRRFGKPVLNPTMPDPEETLPDPDDGLDDLRYPPPRKDPVFRKKWGRFIENVVSRDNFKPGHLDTLEILCDLYVELEILNKFIRMNGMSFLVVMVNGTSRRMYPEVAQRDKIRGQIQQYSRMLDLFPKKDKSLKGMDSETDSEWV